LSCGKIGYVALPVVRYRQHARNIVGVKYDLTRAVRFLMKLHNWRQQVIAVRSSIRQASLLIERIQLSGVSLSRNDLLWVIGQYAGLDHTPRFERLNILKAHKICKRSIVSNLIFELILFSLPLKAK